MSKIQIFKHHAFGEVRIAELNGEPFFCLPDVCKAVELINPSSVKRRLDKEDVQLLDLHALNFIEGGMIGNTMANFITESGFYDVILQSSSPKVKPFRKWVTSEVLPSIRKNGGYLANQENLTPEQIVAQALVVAHSIIDNQKKAIAEMATKMNELKERTDYLDLILESKETVTMTQLAADYGMSAKAMNKLLEKLKIQHKVGGQWILYAKYLGEGYVHSKTILITRSNGLKDTVMNTEWKQKGRLFLYDLLKKNNVLPLIDQ